jgi:hypothetical protein
MTAIEPESNDHIVVKTTERTGRKNVRGAPNQPANTTLKTRSQRAHSWDPSQGSEYEYSDEEATNDPTDPDVEMESIRYNTESGDHDPTDEDASTDDALGDVIQDEDSHDEVRQRSESHDHDHDHDLGVIDLEDFEHADRTNNQMAQRHVTIDHDRFDGHESDHDEIYNNGGLYTHPEPKEASSFQKHKRFGMFAASPAADAEPVAERYMEPPQRLRIKTRRMERERKKFPEKKGRYDLRPRRTLAGDYGEGPLVAELSGAGEPDAEDESENEELKRPRRITRSMKKPIPRSRAARKTAWAAMGFA